MNQLTDRHQRHEQHHRGNKRVTQTRSSDGLEAVLTAAQLSGFLDQAFPASVRGSLGEVLSVGSGGLRMRLVPDASMIRPGYIISGPTLMTLVDVAAYAVIAAHRETAEMAVTNTLSIAFLRSCRPEPIVADAQLMKLGRRQAVVDIRVWQSDEKVVIAQATAVYALPPSTAISPLRT